MDINALAAKVDALESELAIRQLYANYAHGFDKRDRSVFARVWAEDAVWILAPGMEATGPEAIMATADGGWGALEATHHWTTNIVISVNGDSAVGTADVDVNMKAGGAWTRGAYTYHDEFVRRGGTWAIARRSADAHFQEPF